MTEDHRMGSNPLFTRREILGMSGGAALAGIASGTVSHAAERRPRIACVVTYWAAPGSHADWIITKLLDGYWWKGAHTPSRVDVVSVYIHQLQESGLGQKVCKSKGIPIFNTVREALTLGGKELAVDGVVLVGEHGNYHSNLKGQKYYPRWWLYQQIIRVFEQSKRSVPVSNDKHLSTSWDRRAGFDVAVELADEVGQRHGGILAPIAGEENSWISIRSSSIRDACASRRSRLGELQFTCPNSSDRPSRSLRRSRSISFCIVSLSTRFNVRKLI